MVIRVLNVMFVLRAQKTIFPLLHEQNYFIFRRLPNFSGLTCKVPWETMVIHSQKEMLRQRIYQIMAGFEDADDCDSLCRDGILKMCAGRSASDKIDLASQPSMTRLENRLSRRELFDIGEAFIDDFIASYESECPCFCSRAAAENSSFPSSGRVGETK